MEDNKRLGLGQVGDDPITAAGQDRLDRSAFAQRSAELIRLVADGSPSLVAGLIGPWGGGKTSTLAMIAEELDKDARWGVVEFNPWELNDLASLISEFFTTLRSAIGDNRKARKALSRYASKVAPFAAIVPVLGSAGATAVKAAGDQLLGDTSLASQRAQLERALTKIDRKILVLIDDVDRLQGDELTTVLKLVRLVGRLPNISYVLAYDEVTLLDVLGTTDVGGRDAHRALAYLDKIVQLRLDLPPVSTYRIRNLVNQGIDDVTEAHGFALERADAERIGAIYIDCLEPSLTEPRHIKRFFGQVEALYDLVAAEVDFVDFFLITFIRVFFPAVHREVVLNKAELTGTQFEIERTTNEERIAIWEKKLTDKCRLDLDTAKRVLTILGAMFPRLDRYGSGARSARPIGSPEYFGRYLYLTIPPDDFSDAKVDSAVAEVVRGVPGATADELVAAVVDAAEPIIDKLSRVRPSNGTEARALLPFFARVASATPDDAGFMGFAERRAHGLVSDMLKLASIPDASSLVEELLEYLSLNAIAAAVVNAQPNDPDDRVAGSDLDRVGTELGTRLFADLEASAARPPAEAGTKVLWTLTQWECFAGSPERSRDWMREQVERGRWPVEDVVAMFVSVAVYGNGVERLNGVDLSTLETRLGVDWVLDRFAFISSGQPMNEYGESKNTSFVERRRWAHDVLAREAEKRRPPGRSVP